MNESAATPRTSPVSEAQVAYRSVDVGGVRVFYREAGPPAAPALLLLHGFPSSSHMYRALIPRLADRYHVIAPDYPGFGYSDFPDAWNLDWLLLNRPGNIDVQLDLFGDYQSNVALYPEFQRFFHTRRPPTLIVWGERDPFFTVEGARAYQRDLPDADLHLLDAGHFALETHAAEIGALMREFLARRLEHSRGRTQSPSRGAAR